MDDIKDKKRVILNPLPRLGSRKPPQNPLRYFLARKQGFYTVTFNPKNIKHLRTRLDNYPKGPTWQTAFQGLLGQGIFKSDDETWLIQRKTAALEFTTRTRHAPPRDGSLGEPHHQKSIMENPRSRRRFAGPPSPTAGPPSPTDVQQHLRVDVREGSRDSLAEDAEKSVRDRVRLRDCVCEGVVRRSCLGGNEKRANNKDFVFSVKCKRHLKYWNWMLR
ncbi:hypothetical protein QQ045_016380 [Rhodiola kirilowii]